MQLCTVNCNFIFHKDVYTILVSLVSSTRLLPRTFTNVHKSYFYMLLAQNIHKCSQILFLHVACPEHSQMFTNFISTCRLPRTFTNVHKSYFHMSLAQNIHKCSQIFISTCCLPRTFTNVHKSYFHMSLVQNIHKSSQILFSHVSCPEHSQMFTNLISTCLLPRTFTNVHKSYFHMLLAQNIHKCSQILFPHVSCPEHSQMFTNLIFTCLLPRTFTNVHKSYFHMSLAQNIHKCSQMFTNLIIMIYNINMQVESIMRNRNSIKCGNEAVNSSCSATFSTAGPAFLSGPRNGNGTTAHTMCIAPTVFQDSLFCIYKCL